MSKELDEALKAVSDMHLKPVEAPVSQTDKDALFDELVEALRICYMRLPDERAIDLGFVESILEKARRLQ